MRTNKPKDRGIRNYWHKKTEPVVRSGMRSAYPVFDVKVPLMNRMHEDFFGMPEELKISVFALLGADASIKSWISVEQTCRSWRANTGSWFTGWIRCQCPGNVFGGSDGCAGEVAFLLRHLEGMSRRRMSEVKLISSVLVAGAVQVQFAVNRMLNRMRMQLTVPEELSYRKHERKIDYVNTPRVPRVLLSIERESGIGWASTVTSQLDRNTFETFSAKVFPVLRKFGARWRRNPEMRKDVLWYKWTHDDEIGVEDVMQNITHCFISGSECFCSVKDGVLCGNYFCCRNITGSHGKWEFA